MELQNKNLTVEEMKKISQDIILVESKKEEIDIDIFPLTFVEYYNSDIFKKKFKLMKPKDNIYNGLIPIISSGFYDSLEKQIVVFLDKLLFMQKLGSGHQLVDLVEVSYHEFRHGYQHQKLVKNYKSFESAIIFMETVISSSSLLHYNLYHDQYFKEIDANLFAIKKTEEVFKSNSQLYEQYRHYIESKKNEYEYDYMNYNFPFFFKKFNLIYQKHYSKISYAGTWLEAFYTKNGKFKTIAEIMNNQKFEKLDSRIKYVVLSSEEFINQLPFSTLDKDQKALIMKSLLYTYNMELKRKGYNEDNLKQGLISTKDFLISNQCLTNKVSYLLNQINRFGKTTIQKCDLQLSTKHYYEKLPNLIEQFDNSSKKSGQIKK